MRIYLIACIFPNFRTTIPIEAVYLRGQINSVRLWPLRQPCKNVRIKIVRRSATVVCG